MKLTHEAKVGALVLSTIALSVLFAWFLGIQNPFRPTTEFYVTYNFAGGIDIGSPVRVSGIKVGKVKEIDFFPNKDTPVRLLVSVNSKATAGIRKDSKFYINLAGIIGERYIEITPGTPEVASIEHGGTVAGIDPPRIDQLISQSFDLAGKIADLVDKNKDDITRSIELLYKLSENMNKTLKWVDKSKMFKTDLSLLVNNLIAISGDLKKMTAKVDTPEGKQTLELIHRLLWRLEPLDAQAIRKFFQDEGITTRLF